MKTLLLILITTAFTAANITAQNVAEINADNKSLSYDETIQAYQELDKKYATAMLFTEGLTDVGRPLHLFVISADKTFDPVLAKARNKSIILINNGIHPGEPDGIDASVRLAQSYLEGKLPLPDNIVICIIPVYNIDGSLRQGCCTRANQNGPDSQGFRGNSQNLDLNRDFIKCDSENARSFTKIFRRWDPDVFIDTHVSNGSDYQYTMTLISTQHNKLGGAAGKFLKQEMTPALFSRMKAAGHEMAPYVNTIKYDHPPENGIYGFMETPRYASGYAALFGSLAFVPETHMLKPFPQRVEATIKLLEIIIGYTSENSEKIIEIRKKDRAELISSNSFPLSWEADTTRFETFPFRGYEAEYKISKVTQLEQLYYNRNKPFTRDVRFYDWYLPDQVVNRPEFYIIPQAWKRVIELMQLNLVEMTRLPSDSVIKSGTYVIEDFKTGTNPYEGHYLHHSVKLKYEVKEVTYRKGDYVIKVNQPANRYIVETLEPHAPDSWFAWGFFDAILQQKEWFSAYVFDEVAEDLLAKDPDLKKRFNEKRSSDSEFSKSAWAQLYFIYKNSPWFEDLKRYPVGRIEK